VAQVIGFIKGKNAIRAAWPFGRRENFTGQNFSAGGYHVSTMGMGHRIRTYMSRREE
jgi:hypothetical protein